MLALAVGVAPAAAVDPGDLEDRVTVAAVRAHLQELQDIATAHGGNRAAGTAGYEASGAYIEAVLTAAGYTPQRQDFTADTQEITAYSLAIDGLTFTDDTDGDGTVDQLGIPMTFTPSTPAGGLSDVPLVAPPVANGCSDADWAGVDPTGQIALVSRGTCSFGEKVVAAADAGAVAILVYNSEPGQLNGTLGAQTPDLVPAVGILQSQGQTLLTALESGPVTADLTVEQTVTTINTFNIIADTPTGRDDNTVMVGAHLDSVPEGPGLNDNGSGSAAILEIAVQLAQSGELENQVRFAWWGAEEVGLLGSTHYIDDLVENNEAELDRIATYLNFDMVASPNYVISVYDANESTFPAPPGVVIPEGSVATEAAFTDYFDAIGQPWIDSEFDGRSDYEAFILNDIPASGLFTGADAVKTASEAALFGGVVGETQDQNYHTAADDLANINDDALRIMLGAMAFVTASLANDTSAINGVVPVVDQAPAPAVVEQDPNLLAESGGTTPGGWIAGGVLAVLLGAVVTGAVRRRASA